MPFVATPGCGDDPATGADFICRPSWHGHCWGHQSCSWQPRQAQVWLALPDAALRRCPLLLQVHAAPDSDEDSWVLRLRLTSDVCLVPSSEQASCFKCAFWTSTRTADALKRERVPGEPAPPSPGNPPRYRQGSRVRGLRPRSFSWHCALQGSSCWTSTTAGTKPRQQVCNWPWRFIKGPEQNPSSTKAIGCRAAARAARFRRDVFRKISRVD